MISNYSQITVNSNLNRLVEWFSEFDSCIVAFSAGVDSSLLAYAAYKALREKAIAVTSISPSFASSELEGSRKTAAEIGISLIEVGQDDLSDTDYTKNDVSRCYFCRSNLAAAIRPVQLQFSVEVCVDGTHLDDLKKPRPGVKALRENGFRAPLAELHFSKSDIREMAKYSGLSNWNRPSESCLSSRVAYGQQISLETLERIELAEKIVKSLTQAQIVRVRTINNRAVVEVDTASIPSALEKAQEISAKLQQLGYEKVEIDPGGYVSGNMLELFVNSIEK